MKKLLVILVSIMCLLSLAGCSNSNGGSDENQDENKVYKVGVVQLVQHAALDAATQGFIDELKAELGEENVEVDVQNASGEFNNCTIIVNNFINDGVDLIMANATPALKAAVSATGDIPILGTSVTEYGVALEIEDFNGVTGINVSGTSDLAPLDEQAQMIIDLIPGVQTVGILYCSAEENSVYQVKVVKEYLEAQGINVVVSSFSDSNDIASTTEDLCSQVDAIYVPTDNMVASCADTVASIVLPRFIPVITGEEGPCAECGVATLSISYYELGQKTGEMAAKVLTGEADISTMPIEYHPNPVKKYNKEICETYGIEVSDEYIAIE